MLNDLRNFLLLKCLAFSVNRQYIVVSFKNESIWFEFGIFFFLFFFFPLFFGQPIGNCTVSQCWLVTHTHTHLRHFQLETYGMTFIMLCPSIFSSFNSITFFLVAIQRARHSRDRIARARFRPHIQWCEGKWKKKGRKNGVASRILYQVFCWPCILLPSKWLYLTLIQW